MISKRAIRVSGLSILGALGVLAINSSLHAQQRPQQAVAQARSTSGQREEVGITVYNQNFGLVREVRTIDLAAGRTALEFRDVSEQIEPQTVAIKSLGQGTTLHVLEQNYRYDLLSPQKLLEKYVGRKVKVYRWNEKTGKDDAYDAEVLSVAQGGTVMRINGEVTYDFPGRIAFPEIPQNLIAKPTLVWLLDSSGKQKVEVTYLTRNLGWSADYVLVINDTDTAGDLVGWVTLNNNTGTTYENAKLKLVAGDVRRVQAQYQFADDATAAPMGAATGKDGFHEESFFEYHLYTLERPTNLLNAEQKQVTLLEAANLHIDKRLIFFGAAYYYRGNYGQVVSNQKVGVYLDIQNTEANHMGMPLPKGTVRVYKADKAGAKQFIGEDAIDHTPRDEKVRIKMGEAFDVVGDRKQMEWKALGTCVSESAWQIDLRNHKDTATEVEVYEPVGGDWEITQESMPHVKKDANTFTFLPKIPARGAVKITYRVRIRWC